MSYWTSGSITIFEGVDGSGKTTIAEAYANLRGARYIHLGPFPDISPNHLAALYVDAIMPAVLGDVHIVLDRCWISELPYGLAYRGGADRLGYQRRILERLAYRCRTKVFVVNRPEEDIIATFEARKRPEMLKTTRQLSEVYNWYSQPLANITQLPASRIQADSGKSYADAIDGILVNLVTEAVPAYSTPHPTIMCSAGNMNAPIMIVGSRFGNHRNGDPLYQWPFGSLYRYGTSEWLTVRLEAEGIPESSLVWINADEPDDRLLYLQSVRKRVVVALGNFAADRLSRLGIPHIKGQHPQTWLRPDYPPMDEMFAAMREAQNVV